MQCSHQLLSQSCMGPKCLFQTQHFSFSELQPNPALVLRMQEGLSRLKAQCVEFDLEVFLLLKRSPHLEMELSILATFEAKLPWVHHLLFFSSLALMPHLDEAMMNLLLLVG